MTKTARQLQEEGLLYDVFEQELTDIKDRTYGLVSELSRASHFDMEYVMSLVRKIVAKIGQDSYIVPPFRCDYGDHVFIGNNTYINYNCCFLDSAKVTIGDYVYMGPNCNIFTPCHPIHHELRKEKVTEYALPVTVGSHSWIGGDVVITPGVTIGENCVIGAGSVVTKDIPDNSIAVGNPCKVIRQVNDKDREYINSLILDDETKDSKYKQENGYVYSAKDEAIFNIVKDTVHYVEILNKLSNSEIQRRRDFLRTFVAKLDEGAMINSPFYMEFANHLEMGVNSFINYDCIMLNNAMVKLGDNVLVGPKVSFYTAIHPIDAKQREQWLVRWLLSAGAAYQRRTAGHEQRLYVGRNQPCKSAGGVYAAAECHADAAGQLLLRDPRSNPGSELQPGHAGMRDPAEHQHWYARHHRQPERQRKSDS